MTTIDRDFLRRIRPEINAALEAIAKKHGLSQLKCGSATFDPRGGNFVVKVEGVADAGMTKEAAAYETIRRYGDDAYPPLGWEFAELGRESHRYRIVGANSTLTKVICARAFDGKQFLFKREYVRSRYAETKIGAAKATKSSAILDDHGEFN